VNTASPFIRHFAAWLALLALAVQFAAMPLANSQMLQHALDKASVHTITICTPSGSQELQVDADGQPVKPQPGKMAHCALCFVGGSSPLIFGPLVSLIMGFAGCGAKAGQPAPVLPAGAGLYWPWSIGPPL